MNVAEEMKAYTYNGWTNYETWLVNVWLNADKGHYNALTDIRHTVEVDKQPDEIRNWVFANEEWTNDTDNVVTVWRDLVYAALERVNWREIAQANRE